MPKSELTTYQERSALRRLLCLRWISKHRPDIYEIIKAEVERQFPLPESLEKLPIMK